MRIFSSIKVILVSLLTVLSMAALAKPEKVSSPTIEVVLETEQGNIVLEVYQSLASIRNINAMYYPLCQLYLRPVARVSNGYFSGISEVVVIKIDAI